MGNSKKLAALSDSGDSDSTIKINRKGSSRYDSSDDDRSKSAQRRRGRSRSERSEKQEKDFEVFKGLSEKNSRSRSRSSSAKKGRGGDSSDEMESFGGGSRGNRIKKKERDSGYSSVLFDFRVGGSSKKKKNVYSDDSDFDN